MYDIQWPSEFHEFELSGKSQLNGTVIYQMCPHTRDILAYAGYASNRPDCKNQDVKYTETSCTSNNKG